MKREENRYFLIDNIQSTPIYYFDTIILMWYIRFDCEVFNKGSTNRDNFIAFYLFYTIHIMWNVNH